MAAGTGTDRGMGMGTVADMAVGTGMGMGTDMDMTAAGTGTGTDMTAAGMGTGTAEDSMAAGTGRDTGTEAGKEMDSTVADTALGKALDKEDTGTAAGRAMDMGISAGMKTEQSFCNKRHLRVLRTLSPVCTGLPRDNSSTRSSSFLRKHCTLCSDSSTATGPAPYGPLSVLHYFPVSSPQFPPLSLVFVASDFSTANKITSVLIHLRKFSLPILFVLRLHLIA